MVSGFIASCIVRENPCFLVSGVIAPCTDLQVVSRVLGEWCNPCGHLLDGSCFPWEWGWCPV